MRVLITGAQGQLGRSISKISFMYPQHRFFFAGCEELDITNQIALKDFILLNGIEGIINCAAYTAVDRAEDEPEKAFLINAAAVGAMAEICAEHKIKLVHVSTDYVYGGDLDRPLSETDLTNPLNVYGKSKLEGERAVSASGCDSAIVRAQWLYSEFGHNFALTMLNCAQKNKPLSVVNDQFGTPTYATHLAKALMVVLESGCRTGGEVYNYSPEGRTTWYEFAIEIFRVAGIDAAIEPVLSEHYKTKAVRPSYTILDSAKIMSLPGIGRYDWKEGIKEFWSSWNKTQQHGGI